MKGEDKCENCRFYRPNALNTKAGECRRKSPQCFLAKNQLGGPITIGNWPPTAAEYWCGEYEALEDDIGRMEQ